MYQLIIPFISDQLTSFSSQYAPASVDDLISDIRRYIVFMYENPGHNAEKAEESAFSTMHRYIYDNIANRDSGLKMEPYLGRKDILSVTELRGAGNLESNISNVIKDRRAMPKKWEKLLRANSANYTPILYRCFWMLQYYFVYYDRDVCTISRTDKPVSHAASQFIEYFPLTEKKSSCVFSALDEFCYPYTAFFHDNIGGMIDLLSLSRVILDVIIEQINLRQRIHLDRIADASLFIKHDEQTMTEPEQLAEFRKYVDGFGSDAYDRYNMLLKFAPTNCYAADELATMYYWGKTYWIRDNNYFELEQNYEKAAEWYIKAIENSNPPLQSSCWSLSYTITSLKHDTEDERKAAEDKAIEYLKLAGEYPAAYNRIAWFLFRDAEELFKEYGYDTPYYNDTLIQFLSAIRLADRSGAMHWFYGNNQIALFLIRHKNDDKLLHDLKSRLDLHVPFDAQSQLEYAVSYHSPWALKHLALLYIEKNRRSEAMELLKEAMEANYNSAFYEAAKAFHKAGSTKWKELMTKASNLSYCPATYELAVNEVALDEKERLTSLCRQQLLSEKELNTTLLAKLDILSSPI